MKNIIYILTLLVTLTNCEDVVDIKVPNGKSRLVIDASFEYYQNEKPVTIKGGVKLTLSTPFFDSIIPAVSNATVFITDMSNNSIINFIESREKGFYTPDSIQFIPKFKTSYQLTVIHNNETYNAIARLIPTVIIDNVKQGDSTLFEGDETEIIVSFTDDGSRNDFYLFNFDFSLFLASEDRFYQGKTFSFSYFYKNMVDGRDISIKILGIDERYYNYANLLIDQSEENGGNPFKTPPALLRGNIINITNPDNYALGYFNLSEANRYDFTIK
ncbi:DUF4249 family protein [Aquimarina longa]|uniref:DUF4249 family protein n=1 Tax=Aquimarina longa TaxID=1080221 RepID=UPI000783D908|nr:DUF4249 family protein [Aquimarina longa]